MLHFSHFLGEVTHAQLSIQYKRGCTVETIDRVLVCKFHTASRRTTSYLDLPTN